MRFLLVLAETSYPRKNCSAPVHLLACITGHRCISSHDGLTLFVARDRLDIVETVRRPRLHDVDDTFWSTFSIGQDDFRGRLTCDSLLAIAVSDCFA